MVIWLPEYRRLVPDFDTGHNKNDLVKVMGRQIRIRFVKIVINAITNRRNNHEQSLSSGQNDQNYRYPVISGIFTKIDFIFVQNGLENMEFTGNFFYF